MMHGLPEISGGYMKLLAKTAGKGRDIRKAAGKSNLRNGISGGAEHFDGDTESVTEKILLW